ncbi:Protein of uncharacterised function (DUF1020) [Kingella potus]|uniref:Protein of uncharacterized function (DUF1020) n=1 Tax=Kingella potus TaxID=265175 RepID=A0A377R261_9NEIS|nr:MafB family polymorphic toxin [Kingella potus]UOP00752.1 MafB family polymorphic toxin [Kingella potus]STR02847.1 Protein of uncharacterised function (DUF1020) [Kingella potus]
MKKALHKLQTLLLAALLLTGLLPAATADPLADLMRLQQDIQARDFEPGGKYHLFGNARGSVGNRRDTLAPAYHSAWNTGRAQYEGTVRYETRFSNHGHDEHTPFEQHDSRNRFQDAPDLSDGFGVYRIEWTGSQIHPADGYDGPQGGGYPKPKGARDLYSYHVKGSITRIKPPTADERPFGERWQEASRSAADNYLRRMRENGELIMKHNPDRNIAGNAGEVVRGLIGAGVTNFFATGFEGLGFPAIIGKGGEIAAGAADQYVNQGFSRLPPEARAHAVESYADAAIAAQSGYEKARQWVRKHPNTAEVFGAAAESFALRNAATHGFSSKKPASSDFGDAAKGKWEQRREMSSTDGEMAGGNKPINPYQKSAKEMAVELSREIGNKHSVGFQSGEKIGHIDLVGKAHTDKKTEKSYKTPHVQASPKQRRPNGTMQPIKKREEIREASKNDIRTARKLAIRKGWLKK